MKVLHKYLNFGTEQTRRLNSCLATYENGKRKVEAEKDAQRKPEQTSMSRHQMARNNGARQEDDNKSKECFDASIATGNHSINNSSLSTSHSKEKFPTALSTSSIQTSNNGGDYVTSSNTSGASNANSDERQISKELILFFIFPFGYYI